MNDYQFDNDFLSREIKEYLSKGIGSYTKNNFEVLIFQALMRKSLKDKSNYQISRELRISESKVKKLRYEADLTFNHQENYQDEKYKELNKLLEKVRYKSDGKKITFSIEDPSLRKFVDNILKEKHSFSDSSFNTELVTIDSADLIIIYSSFESGKDVIEKANEIIKTVSKKEGYTTHPTFKEIFPELILEIAKTTSGIANTTAGLVNLSTGHLITSLTTGVIKSLKIFKKEEK